MAGTNAGGRISWRYVTKLCRLLKKVEDGMIDIISIRNHAINPADTTASLIIAKCNLYRVSLNPLMFTNISHIYIYIYMQVQVHAHECCADFIIR